MHTGCMHTGLHPCRLEMYAVCVIHVMCKFIICWRVRDERCKCKCHIHTRTLVLVCVLHIYDIDMCVLHIYDIDMCVNMDTTAC